MTTRYHYYFQFLTNKPIFPEITNSMEEGNSTSNGMTVTLIMRNFIKSQLLLVSVPFSGPVQREDGRPPGEPAIYGLS